MAAVGLICCLTAISLAVAAFEDYLLIVTIILALREHQKWQKRKALVA